MRTQIKKVGDSAALFLSEDILDLLGICSGDEVDISVSDGKLIVSPLDDTERRRKIEDVARDVLERRKSAYRQLAEGPP